MSKHEKYTDILFRARTSSKTAARPIAPEDIRPGMYVAVLTEHIKCARWANEFGAEIATATLTMPPYNGQRPSRVRAVCLPFVLVETGKGEPYCYDVRNVRLARVGASFARAFGAIELKKAKKDRKRRDQKTGKSKGGKKRKRRAKAGRKRR